MGRRISLKSKTIIDGGGSDKERAKGEEEGKLKKKERDKWGGQREGQLEMNGAELVAQKGQAACGQNVAQIIFTLFFAFCFLFLLCL